MSIVLSEGTIEGGTVPPLFIIVKLTLRHPTHHCFLLHPLLILLAEVLLVLLLLGHGVVNLLSVPLTHASALRNNLLLLLAIPLCTWWHHLVGGHVLGIGGLVHGGLLLYLIGLRIHILKFNLKLFILILKE